MIDQIKHPLTRKSRIIINDAFVSLLCLSVFYRLNIYNNIVQNIIVVGILVFAFLYHFSKSFRPSFDASIERTEVLLYLYFSYMLFTAVWSPGANVSIIKVVICQLFLFSVKLDDYKEDRFKVLYFAGLILLLLANLFFGEYYYGGNRFSIVVDGVAYEFGVYFGYSILFVAIASEYFLKRKKNSIWGTLFFLCIAIAALYYLLLSGTRGILLAYFAVIIASFLFNKKSFKGLVAFLLLFLASLYIYNSVISDSLRLRFTISDMIGSKASNRFLVWENVISYCKNRGLVRNIVGDGIYSTKLIMGATSDNTILDVFVEFGIIGIALFVLFNVSLILSEIRTKCSVALATHVGMLVWLLSVPLNLELMFWVLYFFLIYQVRKNRL